MVQLPDPHEIYVGGEPTDEGRRALKHQLVVEVKRLIELTALLDPDETPDQALESTMVRARELADEMEELPSLRARGGLALAGGDNGVLAERSGISGRSNPLAPPLHLIWDESSDVTRAWALYSDAYEGPPGCLHGGFIAAAFDDLMGLAQMASGQAGYTGTLTVRMRRPTPLGKRIDYEAWVDHFEGRKIWVKATASDGDTLLADAEILFISPASGMLPHLTKP